MLELDKDTFQSEVLEATGLVVVDFWSPKCEPCVALAPELENLARRYAGRARFCKLNVLENRRLALSQRVLGLPVIAFYRDGQKVAELTGEIAAEKIAETIDALV
ncbi:MAG TPA: thiol reductase thioredoxin [Clostridiales bacterium UBA8153]|nr:thiol reductase thioredoxin [Clostridiales bacterium UBA8153]